MSWKEGYVFALRAAHNHRFNWYKTSITNVAYWNLENRKLHKDKERKHGKRGENKLYVLILHKLKNLI